MVREPDVATVLGLGAQLVRTLFPAPTKFTTALAVRLFRFTTLGTNETQLPERVSEKDPGFTPKLYFPSKPVTTCACELPLSEMVTPNTGNPDASATIPLTVNAVTACAVEAVESSTFPPQPTMAVAVSRVGPQRIPVGRERIE